MDAEEFRKHGHTFIDWMTDYMKSIEDFPVRSQVKAGQISSLIPETPPEEGEPMDEIFADFKETVLPGITHWQHPSFFAYFPANTSPPSILAEMLMATLGAQCMLWQTSPAATELETRMTAWLGHMVGLPADFHGVIQDSASSATLCALLTAREKASGWGTNRRGLISSESNMVVYTSIEAHSSTEKGAKIAGFGSKNVRLIETDSNFSMCVKSLIDAVEIDIDQGKTPTCVVASVGTTGVGAVDPIREIAGVCNKYDIFLHVDAAWAGSAMILPEEREIMDGIELVDSIVFNPHKWLLTNFDCSAHFVKEPESLIRTLSIMPEYLKSRQQGQVIDYRDWSIPLGRRFRALKLWFVIRYYGLEGLKKIIRRHLELASMVEVWINAARDFEIMAPRSLSLINFRYKPKKINDAVILDRLNEQLLNDLNDRGSVYFTQNRVRGIYSIRWSIGQTNTDLKHVKKAWLEVKEVAGKLC
ncbi:MAG: aspartate aminotransferase family protein [Rhodospirillaceae bacterium]|nr:aspartate aminotransferase family protein [Rhodospirillaceae bacterium]